MNSQKINELMDILDYEAGIYEDLLKISQNKTDVIIKGKVNELDNITKLEQSLILNMGKLEASREKLVNDLSAEVNVNPSKITITELLKHLDANQARRLESYKTNLLNTIKEIKENNELNSKLIKNSIEYINFSINIISSAPAADNNYGNTGMSNEAKKRSYFDVKL
ncbi:flagellar protein FlgN [Acetivibrio cellulolyticus]|uniref:flagellar protein FlgN n=1 Tax=Acetivibrio cellulolyticus TaxID=35830 RepID=UPI0001E30135|nr:flagellar protein FlgN [Acetivibrio cellulolyticus]